MQDLLSQDEIDALLHGIDDGALDDDYGAEDDAEAEQEQERAKEKRSKGDQLLRFDQSGSNRARPNADAGND